MSSADQSNMGGCNRGPGYYTVGPAMDDRFQGIFGKDWEKEFVTATEQRPAPIVPSSPAPDSPLGNSDQEKRDIDAEYERLMDSDDHSTPPAPGTGAEASNTQQKMGGGDDLGGLGEYHIEAVQMLEGLWDATPDSPLPAALSRKRARDEEGGPQEQQPPPAKRKKATRGHAYGAINHKVPVPATICLPGFAANPSPLPPDSTPDASRSVDNTAPTLAAPEITPEAANDQEIPKQQGPPEPPAANIKVPPPLEDTAPVLLTPVITPETPQNQEALEQNQADSQCLPSPVILPDAINDQMVVNDPLEQAIGFDNNDLDEFMKRALWQEAPAEPQSTVAGSIQAQPSPVNVAPPIADLAGTPPQAPVASQGPSVISPAALPANPPAQGQLEEENAALRRQLAALQAERQAEHAAISRNNPGNNNPAPGFYGQALPRPPPSGQPRHCPPLSGQSQPGSSFPGMYGAAPYGALSFTDPPYPAAYQQQQQQQPWAPQAAQYRAAGTPGPSTFPGQPQLAQSFPVPHQAPPAQQPPKDIRNLWCPTLLRGRMSLAPPGAKMCEYVGPLPTHHWCRLGSLLRMAERVSVYAHALPINSNPLLRAPRPPPMPDGSQPYRSHVAWLEQLLGQWERQARRLYQLNNSQLGAQPLPLGAWMPYDDRSVGLQAPADPEKVAHRLRLVEMKMESWAGMAGVFGNVLPDNQEPPSQQAFAQLTQPTPKNDNGNLMGAGAGLRQLPQQALGQLPQDAFGQLPQQGFGQFPHPTPYNGNDNFMGVGAGFGAGMLMDCSM